MWFDCKFIDIDYLLFLRLCLLSVYVDMSNICCEYVNFNCFMLELVLVLVKDWIIKFD